MEDLTAEERAKILKEKKVVQPAQLFFYFDVMFSIAATAITTILTYNIHDQLSAK